MQIQCCQTTKVLDKGSVEWIGPFGMWVILNKISKTLSLLSKGLVTDYALYILISLCIMLSLFSFIFLNLDCLNVSLLTSVIILLGVNNYINKENL